MRFVPRRLGLLAPLFAVVLVLGLGACAKRPPASDADATQEYNENNDPLEPANRVSFAVNAGLDTYFLEPVARGYRYAVPGVIRRPIHNVVTNMTTPVLFINDVVQTRPRAAGDTFMRFLINTTVGVGGMFDVAADWGYPFHDNDFGLTLALWGVPSGPFLFLPLLGPSNPRDTVGYGVDIAFNPFTWAPTGYDLHTVDDARAGVAILDTRTNLLDEVDSIKKTALDPYATFRSLSTQNRQSTIDTIKSEDRRTVPNWYAP